jgi:hypothetical protein
VAPARGEKAGATGSRSVSEEAELALCVLYAALVVALILLGHRHASYLVTGAFTAGLSGWKLWWPRPGETRRATTGFWMMLAGSLVTFALSVPWPI